MRRYISIITVLMLMFMPMSTVYAAASSLFNSHVDSQIQIELATDYTNTHDGLEIVVDGDVTVVDETVLHDILFSDLSHDNQGSGGVSVSIFTRADSDRIDWTSHVYLDNGATYELTSVPLPAELRPPIYA